MQPDDECCLELVRTFRLADLLQLCIFIARTCSESLASFTLTYLDCSSQGTTKERSRDYANAGFGWSLGREINSRQTISRYSCVVARQALRSAASRIVVATLGLENGWRRRSSRYIDPLNRCCRPSSRLPLDPLERLRPLGRSGIGMPE